MEISSGAVKAWERKTKRFLATGTCDGKKLGEQRHVLFAAEPRLTNTKYYFIDHVTELTHKYKRI